MRVQYWNSLIVYSWNWISLCRVCNVIQNEISFASIFHVVLLILWFHIFNKNVTLTQTFNEYSIKTRVFHENSQFKQRSTQRKSILNFVHDSLEIFNLIWTRKVLLLSKFLHVCYKICTPRCGWIQYLLVVLCSISFCLYFLSGFITQTNFYCSICGVFFS